MGLLEGRKALVFGVANDHSIAWGIAKAFHEHGATVGFSSVESLIERRVRPLAESIGATFVEPCDVQSDDEIRAVLANVAASRTARSTSSSTPSPTRSARTSRRRSSTRRARATCSRVDVSAYSLVAHGPRRPAAPPPRQLDPHPDLLGAEKVSTNYNVMGVAKAALEATVRYLAADLGPEGIRVNAISAGPIRTLSAGGIRDFRKLYGPFDQIAPMRAHVTKEDVGNTAAFLASDLAGAITGEITFVDGGFNIMGVPSLD